MNPLLVQRRAEQTTFTVCTMAGDRLWGITGQRLGEAINLTVFDASQYVTRPIRMASKNLSPTALEQFCHSDKKHDKFQVFEYGLMGTRVTLINHHMDSITRADSVLVVVKSEVGPVQFPLNKGYLLELCKEPLK